MSVIVGGMYRNGTTFVAKLLKDTLRYYGGEPHQLKPHILEYRKIIKLSNKVLRKFGATAFNVDHMHEFDKAFNFNTFDFSQMQSWDMSAYRVIYELKTQQGSANDIFWKDTRLPITIPFWYRVILDGKYIFCYRHPEHAIESMHEMRYKWSRFEETYPYEKGLFLWKIYYQRLLDWLKISNEISYIGIDYKEWVDDFDTTVSRLSTFLGEDIDTKKAKLLFNPTKNIADFDDLPYNDLYNQLKDFFNDKKI